MSDDEAGFGFIVDRKSVALEVAFAVVAAVLSSVVGVWLSLFVAELRLSPPWLLTVEGSHTEGKGMLQSSRKSAEVPLAAEAWPAYRSEVPLNIRGMNFFKEK